MGSRAMSHLASPKLRCSLAGILNRKVRIMSYPGPPPWVEVTFLPAAPKGEPFQQQP